MKILVAYYSRTGATKKVAEYIAGKLNADLDEIIDKKDRSGVRGYVISGIDASLKRPADLEEPKKNPGDYDIVVLGTPVWNGTVSTPMRTYIQKYKDKFRDVAFFCTYGTTGNIHTMKSMKKNSGKEPIAKGMFQALTVENNKFREKADQFISAIINNRK